MSTPEDISMSRTRKYDPEQTEQLKQLIPDFYDSRISSSQLIGMIEQHLSANADPNVIGHKEKPFFLEVLEAVSTPSEHYRICHTFNRHGAKLDCVDKKGRSALFYTVNPEFANELMHHGVKASVPDKDGVLAKDVPRIGDNLPTTSSRQRFFETLKAHTWFEEAQERGEATFEALAKRFATAQIEWGADVDEKMILREWANVFTPVLVEEWKAGTFSKAGVMECAPLLLKGGFVYRTNAYNIQQTCAEIGDPLTAQDVLRLVKPEALRITQSYRKLFHFENWEMLPVEALVEFIIGLPEGPEKYMEDELVIETLSDRIIAWAENEIDPEGMNVSEMRHYLRQKLTPAGVAELDVPWGVLSAKAPDANKGLLMR